MNVAATLFRDPLAIVFSYLDYKSQKAACVVNKHWNRALLTQRLVVSGLDKEDVRKIQKFVAALLAELQCHDVRPLSAIHDGLDRLIAGSPHSFSALPALHIRSIRSEIAQSITHLPTAVVKQALNAIDKACIPKDYEYIPLLHRVYSNPSLRVNLIETRSISGNKDLIADIVCPFPDTLLLATGKQRKDQDFILRAVQQNCRVLQFVNKNLKINKSFMLRACQVCEGVPVQNDSAFSHKRGLCLKHAEGVSHT